MSFMSRLAQVHREHEIDSIVRNLTYILNTKKGYGFFSESFGLGDYDAHLSTVDLMNKLVAEIEESVLTYEPRIREPKVVPALRNPQLWLRLSLSGTIAGSPEVFFLDLHTVYRNVVVLHARSQ